jgi:hypothetical protein
MKNELKTTWKEATVAYPGICKKVRRKFKKFPVEAPAEYKPNASPGEKTCSLN